MCADVLQRQDMIYDMMCDMIYDIHHDVFTHTTCMMQVAHHNVRLVFVIQHDAGRQCEYIITS